MRWTFLLLWMVAACVSSVEQGFDEVIEGRLEPGDARLDDGTTYDAFELRGKKGQRLRAVLVSEDFDPMLHLLGAGDARIASNDDARFGVTRAEIEEVLPEDGTYKLMIVAAPKTQGHGAYRLEVELVSP
ncbi:MAG: hypothetical protein GXY23_14020 [Myxococcales bacterium]|nr:hypothetical protein [Myxococcales bacterium]